MKTFMCYLWQQRLYNSLKLADGSEVDVVHPGLLNLDGPCDFFNAKIRINGDLFAGNVTIHPLASDKEYRCEFQGKEGVVLDIVFCIDMAFTCNEDTHQAVMYVPRELFNMRNKLVKCKCFDLLGAVPRIIINDWKVALGIKAILDLNENEFKKIKGDEWKMNVLGVIGAALGKTKPEAFRCRMKRLNLDKLIDEGVSQKELCLIIMGDMGVLNSPEEKKELKRLNKRFGISSYTKFPDKIFKEDKDNGNEYRKQCGLIAEYLWNKQDIFRKIFDGIINVSVNDFEKRFKHAPFSYDMNRSIILGLARLILHYAQFINENEMCEKAVNVIETQLPYGFIGRQEFVDAGISFKHSFDSLGFERLKKEYCDKGKCLNCRIGCWLTKNCNKLVN